MPPAYAYLLVAIAFESVATAALKTSDGFTRLWPSLIVAVGYAVSFYFLSLSLRDIPVGVAYAMWSALGVLIVTIIGWVAFGQRLDAPAVIGLGMIVGGVVVIQVFSRTAGH